MQQLALPLLRLPHGRRGGVSRIKTTIMVIQAHLCWHNATRTVWSLALPRKHTGMDGKLVDVARRGVCRLMINFMTRGARRRRNHGEESGEA